MSRVGRKEGVTAGESVVQVFIWQSIWHDSDKLSINPAILLLGIYPKGILAKFYARRNMRMFTMALFVATENWKQSGWKSLEMSIVKT